MGKALGLRLQEALDIRGFTQGQLELKSGVTQQHISMIITGERKSPGIEKLSALRLPDPDQFDLASARARLSDPATARDLLRTLIQRIILRTDGSLHIHYHFPGADRSMRGPPLGVLCIDLSAQWKKGAHP